MTIKRCFSIKTYFEFEKLIKFKKNKKKILIIFLENYLHGLSILILKENIDYIKLKSNKVVLNKINQIAKKNKVLMNPDFDIIEISKIKDLTKINI